MRKAMVLPVACQFGNPNRPPAADERAGVRAENGWTSQPAARRPGGMEEMPAMVRRPGRHRAGPLPARRYRPFHSPPRPRQ
jgi:hypothetical protein